MAHCDTVFEFQLSDKLLQDVALSLNSIVLYRMIIGQAEAWIIQSDTSVPFAQ